MSKWLAVGAAASLAWASGASAQMKGLSLPDLAGAPHAHAPDLRISGLAPIPQWRPLSGDMLVSRELAPNAAIGLGFGSVHGRKHSGSDMRVRGGSGRSHRPSLTFLMHF